ncbi:MAG: helix-turn-helix domain-containing protein [Kordiimonas sp.]
MTAFGTIREPFAENVCWEMKVDHRTLSHGSDLPLSETQGLQEGLESPAVPPKSGTCIHIPIRPGFDLICYDMIMSETTASEWTMSPGLSLMLLSHAQGDTSLEVPSGAAFCTPMVGGAAYVVMAKKPIVWKNTTDAGARFRGIDLQISSSFLERSGLNQIYSTLHEGNAFRRHASRDLWMGSIILKDQLQTFLEKLLQHTHAYQSTDDLIIEAKALDILHMISNMLSHEESDAEQARMPVEQAITAITDMPERQWTTASLAKLCGINEKSFKQQFKAVTGCTPRYYLQRIRVELGRRLILEKGMSVTLASVAVGYDNPSHFAKIFKRFYNVPPSQIHLNLSNVVKHQ